jgi:hypothetical protein
LSTPPPSEKPEPRNPDDFPPSGGQVSGQPWSTPSGDPLAVEPYQPPAPPPPPTYSPGYAPLPTPAASEWARPSPEEYPPTTQFEPPPPGYEGQAPGNEGQAPGYEAQAPGYQPPQQYAPPPGYGPSPGYPPGYGPPPPQPPRKSNVPLVAVIVAVAILLCGGTVTAGVLVVRNVTDRAKEAVAPITDPTVPAVPTDIPDLPGLPTDLPTLPTDLPGLGGDSGKKITVAYQVTGDGPAEIVYAEKLGATPKRVTKAKLPFKVTTTMDATAFLLVTAVRGDGDGSISCRATVNGKEVVQSTREGRFASVTCSKLVFG